MMGPESHPTTAGQGEHCRIAPSELSPETCDSRGVEIPAGGGLRLNHPEKGERVPDHLAGFDCPWLRRAGRTILLAVRFLRQYSMKCTAIIEKDMGASFHSVRSPEFCIRSEGSELCGFRGKILFGVGVYLAGRNYAREVLLRATGKILKKYT